MWFWLMILACLSTINILYRKELILIKFQNVEFIRFEFGLDLIKPEGADFMAPRVGHSFWRAGDFYWL